jgi:gamma-glutamylcyclotransferase (GGCT)/AIG2-like uncharacterized protein YtfP
VVLFVYGSMKKGFVNHEKIKNFTCLGEAITEEEYVIYPAEHYLFPFMSKKEKKFHIKGELYVVEDEYIISVLDKEEGAPLCYQREEVVVVSSENQKYIAQVYFKNEEHHPVVSDEAFPLDEWSKTDELNGLNCLEFCKADI